MAIKKYVASKDNTITNAFGIDLNTRSTGSNMGAADILEASYRNASSVDAPLTKIDRSTYQALSNKTATGVPSQYWVQRFIDRVTMTIYLTPSSSQNGHTINYNYIKKPKDSNWKISKIFPHNLRHKINHLHIWPSLRNSLR